MIYLFIYIYKSHILYQILRKQEMRFVAGVYTYTFKFLQLLLECYEMQNPVGRYFHDLSFSSLVDTKSYFLWKYVKNIKWGLECLKR